jgi:hypothetical protein
LTHDKEELLAAHFCKKARPETKTPAYKLAFVLLGVTDGARTHDNQNHKLSPQASTGAV